MVYTGHSIPEYQDPNSVAALLNAKDARIAELEQERDRLQAEVERLREEPKGLHGKYLIIKTATGEPIDFPAFVLRIDGSDPHALAALRAYADSTDNQELAADLCTVDVNAAISEAQEAQK